MSVINQMLKELEQRQDEQSSSTSQASATQIPSKLPGKVTIAIIVFLVVIFNIIGLYIWSLYTENETLKNSVMNANIQKNKVVETVLLPDKNKEREEIKNNETKIQTGVIQLENETNAELISKANIVHQNNQLQTLNTQVVDTNKKTILAQTIAKLDSNTTQYQQSPKELKTTNTVITPLTEEVIIEKVPKSSLSISRSKLSPERAVKKKLEKAERAIIDNEVLKAEKLFEDILLIQPEHKGARKQLSALWFGRKLLRPSLNLLSKGIELHPNDVDFRLMKARILLSQNNNKEAFYVLNEYSTVQNIEYQALLATTADALGNVNSVILAYQQLIKIEEHKGKWWLGLAVALDRTSQFEEAKAAYKTALSKGSLSSDSAQFIRQRMIELGE